MNTFMSAQDNKFSAIVIDYGYHIPSGEISNTFGNNSSVGINFIKNSLIKYLDMAPKEPPKPIKKRFIDLLL